MVNEKSIDFARENMPVVELIGMKWEFSRIFKGKRIVLCNHITKETAAAAIQLQRAGAEVILTASNPMSIQEDVAEALREKYGVTVLAYRGESNEEWINYRRQALDYHPDLILDDSAEILPLLYDEKPDCADNLIGSVEQTTAGAKKIAIMDRMGMLKAPVINAAGSCIKYWFENKYGVGQSALNTISILTKDLVAGMTVVIVGYGPVGQGCASRFAGAGAHVIISEVDPVKALQAFYDGYRVMDIESASKYGDLFLSVTGTVNAIPIECIEKMKSGARLVNLGSGQGEIDVSNIKERAVRLEELTTNETRYYFENGKSVILVMDGRSANHVVTEGDPPSIMDLTFAVILLSLEYLIENQGKLEHHILNAPYEEDCKIAYLKLNELGVNITKKTQTQIEYDRDWHKR